MVSYNTKFADRTVLLLRSPLFTTFVCRSKNDIFEKVKLGDYEAVKQYLKSGGDPNTAGHVHLKATRSEGFSMQWSLLYEAASLNNVAVFEILALAVGKQNESQMSTSLWLACRYGNVDVVQWLLHNTCANIHECQQCSYNGALNAVENGHLDVARYIIENCELDVNSTNDNWSESLLHLVIARERFDGRTPLHDAVEIDEIDEVYHMLAKGYYVDIQDNNGVSPLHVACEYGRIDIFHVLYAASADTKLKDNFGHSALDIAIRTEHSLLISYLADDLGITLQQALDNQNSTPFCDDVASNKFTNNTDSTNIIYHKNMESETFDMTNVGKSYLRPKEFGFYLKFLLYNIKLGRELIKSNIMAFLFFAYDQVKAQLIVMYEQKRAEDNYLRYVQKKLKRALQIFKEVFAQYELSESQDSGGKLKQKSPNIKVHYINSEPPEVHFFFPVVDHNIKSSTSSSFALFGFIKNKVLPFLPRFTKTAKVQQLKKSDSCSPNLPNYTSVECLQMTIQMDKLKDFIGRSSNDRRAAEVIASVLDNTRDGVVHEGSGVRELLITPKKAKELVECVSCILQKYLVNQDMILIYYFFGAFYSFFACTLE